jgi:hypothetical protein
MSEPTEIETLQHFKHAYSRALDFVCELHLAALPPQLADDPFLVAGTGNCCATDLLIGLVKQILPCPTGHGRGWNQAYLPYLQTRKP